MHFDLDDYKARTARLAFDDLDFGAFATRPLSAEALRCLRYMHDVEFHTVCYLRDLLHTSAHADPEVTAFLTFWNFEEFWHGEALGGVLAAHGEAGDTRVAEVRARTAARTRTSALASGLGSLVGGQDFVAVHMAWGALNEWTTQAGYARLAAREEHPVLDELLRRIMRQEGRHIDFYASQAEERLARSARARRLTRFALRRFWRPVGSGVMPRVETEFVVWWLFDGADGLAVAQRIDRRVDRLPGLAELCLVERARIRRVGIDAGAARALIASPSAAVVP